MTRGTACPVSVRIASRICLTEYPTPVPIERVAEFPPQWQFKRDDVRGRKIIDMDIISNCRPIRCLIVRSEDCKIEHMTQNRHQRSRDQMCLRIAQLADSG